MCREMGRAVRQRTADASTKSTPPPHASPQGDYRWTRGWIIRHTSHNTRRCIIITTLTFYKSALTQGAFLCSQLPVDVYIHVCVCVKGMNHIQFSRSHYRQPDNNANLFHTTCFEAVVMPILRFPSDHLLTLLLLVMNSNIYKTRVKRAAAFLADNLFTFGRLFYRVCELFKSNFN